MSYKSIFGKSKLAEDFFEFIEEYGSLQFRDVEKHSIVFFCVSYEGASNFAKECSSRFGVSVTIAPLGTGWLVHIPRELPSK